MAGFSGGRKIPKRIDIIGPRDKGTDYIGKAESQLKILENQMGLAEKSGYPQEMGTRTVKFPWGVIEAWKTKDLCGVKITTFDEGGKLPKLKDICFCGCSVTAGRIITKEDMPCCFSHLVFQQYDVEICRQHDRFVMLKNIYASDFTYYNKGDTVLVSVMPQDWSADYTETSGCKIKENAVIIGLASYLYRWRDDIDLHMF